MAKKRLKLWHLLPIYGLPNDDNPWEPWYDKTFGFVVRAATEDEARGIAQSNAEEEECEKFKTPWTDSKYSTCVELTPDGPIEVVIRDHARA